VKTALQFIALDLCAAGELRSAEWTEIDLNLALHWRGFVQDEMISYGFRAPQARF